MIIEAPTSAGDMSSSKILQHNATPVVVDSPPAYSDIHGPYNGQGSGVRREQSYRISPAMGQRSRRGHRHNRSRDQGNGNAGDHDREYHEPSQAAYNYNHGHRHEHRREGTREWAPPPAHQPSLGNLQMKTQLPAIPAEEESPSAEDGPRTMIPMPTADQIHISDARHEIKGTFYVDPLIEPLDPSRRKKKSKDVPPHASFRTRNQEIDIELATTGNVEKASKAKVAVSSAAGHIKVKLLAMHASRPRIGLDVQSRHGDIVMFIPDNYVGVIQLSTRKGKLQVLPALTSHMKIVKSSEHDMLFMVGDAHKGDDTSREASFCDLSSRTGSVIIGLSNRDTYAPRPGFWKRMGSLLKGESPSPEPR